MRARFAVVAALTAALGAQPVLAQISRTAPAQPTETLLRGAGATLPAPLYKRWIEAYRKVEPATRIEYAEVGSGEGTKRFLAEMVDFGATDAALSDEQMAEAKQGVRLVPATAGMVVLAYNLPGIGETLKLSRDVYVDIFAGKIRKWNDPRIKAINPALVLPIRTINVVVRQDSSGTTFALTNHLNATSSEWRDRGPGVGRMIDWPGNAMVARGNEGVASRVKLSEGALGYVEYSYAKRLGLATAALENKAGRYVAPSDRAGQAAIASNLKEIPANLRIFLPDPEGAEAYPIVTFSWLLLPERYSERSKVEALKRFVTWALDDGQAYSADLGYIPLPRAVASLGKETVARLASQAAGTHH
jgi:phosphate transport system substrate-binding protein